MYLPPVCQQGNRRGGKERIRQAAGRVCRQAGRQWVLGVSAAAIASLFGLISPGIINISPQVISDNHLTRLEFSGDKYTHSEFGVDLASFYFVFKGSVFFKAALLCVPDTVC